MANIDYEKVGWNSSTSLGPTNFGHMDDGIKAACDKLDNIGDEVLGARVVSQGPQHEVINADNATTALNDSLGHNIAQQFEQVNNTLTFHAEKNIGTVSASAYTDTEVTSYTIPRNGNVTIGATIQYGSVSVAEYIYAIIVKNSTEIARSPLYVMANSNPAHYISARVNCSANDVIHIKFRTSTARSVSGGKVNIDA